MKSPTVLSALSGISFALLGLAYSLGERHGILPFEVIFVSSTVGMIVFAARRAMERPPAPPLSAVPRVVLTCGIAAALSQFLAMALIGTAMRLGPLSPLWCAVSLGFVPVILLSALRFGERLDVLKVSAAVTAVACVVVSSFSGSSGGGTLASLRQVLVYAGVLLTILLLNSVMSVVIKILGMQTEAAGRTLAVAYQTTFLSTVYTGIALASGTAMIIIRSGHVPWAAMWPYGLLGALGSTVGLALLTAAAHGSAAVVFTVNGVSSILAASLISILYLGEPMTGIWFGTIGLGTLSVLLGGWSESRARASARL